MDLMLADVTKWPRLLVSGSRVTEEQANEILIRTNAWQYAGSGNDRAWASTIAELAGYDVDDHSWPKYPQFQEWKARMGVLDLHYLHNERVQSSWIGGPHGWCRWDGTIWTTSYNIGKWPSVEEVHEDWAAIAAAFPYLTLTAQLVPNEGEGDAVVEWFVDGGEAVLRAPTTPLPVVDMEDSQMFSVLMVGGERGVSRDRLAAAIAQVQGRVV